jgi:quercetin dioxygenase-like cupin family protein
MRTARLITLLMCCLPVSQAAVDDDGFVRIRPDEIAFSADNPEGPDIAILAGDPAKPGFYLLRARFHPGVFSSPHYHSTDRHVTVIKGTWYTGTDASFDRDKTIALGPGSYMMHPAGAIHYDGAKDEEVIVEIKGIGPTATVRLPRE